MKTLIALGVGTVLPVCVWLMWDSKDPAPDEAFDPDSVRLLFEGPQEVSWSEENLPTVHSWFFPETKRPEPVVSYAL